MAPPPVKGVQQLKQRLAGLVMLATLFGLVALSIAFYNKAFTPVIKVALETERAGNQLSKTADVKVRGVLVGEVREITSTGTGARLELAIKPEMAKLVGPEVRAQLLPKTLFGEKFVALDPGNAPPSRPLRDGDIIRQDQSSTSIESEKAFNDLMPLIVELRPDRLSTTLNALSSTVRGKGDRIGESLVLQDQLFREYNAILPQIQENIRGLADLAENYDAAAPDILNLLDDSSFSSRALVDQKEELARFLAVSTKANTDFEKFLSDNEEVLKRLPAESLTPLRLYAKYSPQTACLSRGLVDQHELLVPTLGGKQPGLHITLKPTRDLNEYKPNRDETRFGDKAGPTCRGLPLRNKEVPFPVYRNGIDGYRDGEPINPRTGRTPSDTSSEAPAPPGPLAGALNMEEDDVPDVAHILAPAVLMRGSA